MYYECQSHRKGEECEELGLGTSALIHSVESKLQLLKKTSIITRFAHEIASEDLSIRNNIIIVIQANMPLAFSACFGKTGEGACAWDHDTSVCRPSLTDKCHNSGHLISVISLKI